jgi:hypothetical protein
MTPEKQRIAIAEACGWKCAGHPDQKKATDGWEFGYQFVIRPEGQLVTHNSIPDYLNDLNAMHEAEKVLTEKQIRSYAFILSQVLDTSPTVDLDDQFLNIHANAAQRCEAFLKTLNLWEDES